MIPQNRTNARTFLSPVHTTHHGEPATGLLLIGRAFSFADFGPSGNPPPMAVPSVAAAEDALGIDAAGCFAEHSIFITIILNVMNFGYFCQR